jgi:hypothetical protein
MLYNRGAKITSFIRNDYPDLGTGCSRLGPWLLGRQRLGGSWFQATQDKKVFETSLSVGKSWAMMGISGTAGNMKKEDCCPGEPGQKVRPYI